MLLKIILWGRFYYDPILQMRTLKHTDGRSLLEDTQLVSGGARLRVLKPAQAPA